MIVEIFFSGKTSSLELLVKYQRNDLYFGGMGPRGGKIKGYIMSPLDVKTSSLSVSQLQFI